MSQKIKPVKVQQNHEHIITRIAFVIIGLTSNFGYYIGISAALDLIGQSYSRRILLFCDIFPAFFVILIYTMFHQYLSIIYIVPILAVIGCLGYILAGLTTDFGSWSGIIGIIFLSIQASGEGPFLALSASYLSDCLAMYFVGTGLAGILGFGFYAILTSVFQIDYSIILFSFAFLPLLLLIALWMLSIKPSVKQQLADSEKAKSTESISSVVISEKNPDAIENQSFKAKLRVVGRNWVAYLSLLLAFICQYSITIGIIPTIFPGNQVQFQKFSKVFLQIGVLIGRSTTTIFSTPYWSLPIFSACCWTLFIILFLQSVYRFMESVWVTLSLVPLVGFFSGICYANTAWQMQKRNILKGEREFALSFSGTVINFGILCAGIVGISVEKFLKRRHQENWGKWGNY